MHNEQMENIETIIYWQFYRPSSSSFSLSNEKTYSAKAKYDSREAKEAFLMDIENVSIVSANRFTTFKSADCRLFYGTYIKYDSRLPNPLFILSCSKFFPLSK